MDRLSGMDAALLAAERNGRRSHLLGVLVFDGPAPPIDVFRRTVRARLSFVHRFRQHPREVPVGLGRPVWQDDEHFDLAYHVRHTSLPRPGREPQLRALCDRISAQPLDTARPLWELWLVEGLARSRWAIISKVHPALVDGVSTVDLSDTLLTSDPAAPLPRLPEWRPQAPPSSARLALDGAADVALGTAGAGIAAARAVAPVPLARAVATAVARALAPAPRTSLNAPRAGRDRQTVWVRTPLSALRSVGDALGATVTDVVLAVVGDAVGRYLHRRGERPEAVRVLVPVSVLLEAERGVLGNRVTAMTARVPVGGDARERVLAVAAETSRLLRHHQAVPAKALAGLGGFAPPTVLAQAVRVGDRAPLYNLAVANIPGPSRKLYCCGRALREILPTAPVTPAHALGVAAMTYRGRMAIGVSTDPVRVPAAEFAADLDAAIGVLSGSAIPAAGTVRALPGRSRA